MRSFTSLIIAALRNARTIMAEADTRTRVSARTVFVRTTVAFAPPQLIMMFTFRRSIHLPQIGLVARVE